MANSNQNKNIIEVSEKKLKEKGVLKVLNIVISEDEEDKYNCITEEGKVVIIPASELLE